jgi:hypothetical protein
LRAIQAFYTYAKSRDLDIDEAILACHFEAILALLDGYALWLHSGRQADNLVARIGTAATAPFPQIDPSTRDQYLRLLKLYLSWCVTRYIPRSRQTASSLANIEVVFADVADVIERRFESHILNIWRFIWIAMGCPPLVGRMKVMKNIAVIPPERLSRSLYQNSRII